MDTTQKKEALKEKKVRMKKYTFWVIAATIVIYTLFFTRYNILNYWQIKQDNRRIKSELVLFRINNEHLKLEIEDLRDNPEAWERIAREKYGMQREDEKVIEFRDEDK